MPRFVTVTHDFANYTVGQRIEDQKEIDEILSKNPASVVVSNSDQVQAEGGPDPISADPPVDASGQHQGDQGGPKVDVNSPEAQVVDTKDTGKSGKNSDKTS